MRKVLTYFLSFLFFFSVYAEEFKFVHHTKQEGLSNNTVLSLLEDEAGFLWIGTKDGLNRYDGYEYKRYKYQPKGKQVIPNNVIWDMCKLKSGRLLFATESGIIMKEAAFEDFSLYETKGLPYEKTVVKSLLEDNHGNLWIGYADKGVKCLDMKTFEVLEYHVPTEHSPDFVFDIYEDKNGIVWISTHNGLLKYDYSTHSFSHFYKEEAIASVANYNDSVLVVGSYTSGLSLWNINSNRRDAFLEFEEFMPNEKIVAQSFAVTENEIWVGTKNGLFCYDRKNQTIKSFMPDEYDDNSLNNKEINILYRDSNGSLWTGMFNAGVDLVSKEDSKFKRIRKSNGLSNNSVYAIYQDEDHHLWVGSDGGGVDEFDSDGNKLSSHVHTNFSNSLSGNAVMSIAEDNSGMLWVGTWGMGLNLMHKKSGSCVRIDTFQSHNIWHIMKGSDGYMWLSTIGGGVVRVNPENMCSEYIDTKERRPGCGSLPSDVCWYTMDDGLGHVWIASNGGLSKYDIQTRKVMTYSHDDEDSQSLSLNWIIFITQTRDGKIWLGTHGGGLNCFDPKTEKFVCFAESDGLSNNIVNAIGVDKNDNLWVSTNSGIDFFDRETATFTNYRRSDGVQENQFQIGAYFKSNNEVMYWGGLDGITYFMDDEVSAQKMEIRLVFTDFLLFGKRVSDYSEHSPIQKGINQAEKITLTYSQDYAVLQFAAIDFRHNSQFKYAYKLEGMDNDWHVLDGDRTVVFNYLPAGVYKLMVKASNGSNSVIKTIMVEKKPAWWQTWWFKWLVVIIIVCSAVSFYLIRMRKVRKINDRLESQVIIRTQKIIETNQQIQQQNEELRNLSEQLRTSNYQLAEEKSKIETQIDNLLSQQDVLKEQISMSDPLRLKASEHGKESADLFTTMVREKILSHIDDSNYSIDNLYTDLGYSRAQFFRKFKEEFNYSPSSYIRKVRLTYAVELMRQNKYRISEISDLCGFGDPSHFSKLFVAEYGMSPSEYQKSVLS